MCYTDVAKANLAKADLAKAIDFDFCLYLDYSNNVSSWIILIGVLGNPNFNLQRDQRKAEKGQEKKRWSTVSWHVWHYTHVSVSAIPNDTSLSHVNSIQCKALRKHTDIFGVRDVYGERGDKSLMEEFFNSSEEIEIGVQK